jgi:hypothetical protein
MPEYPGIEYENLKMFFCRCPNGHELQSDIKDFNNLTLPAYSRTGENKDIVNEYCSSRREPKKFN